ncbi:MAG TPA: LLM class flavin-dependent oxidoreductase [Verrucomicrobiae bacterium]|jgi:alkanesulfonate monooxygenase SsuD/methylene tetrahydromethanopterin reductase-like flavin-dependent oxidoreductase (luciferase family)|nr:LLM class flavin-dependent oxidoreductase [Verrucomicrobiae bacterium]
MITKFATVYPGHVDLPDMGQMATPANERRFSNDHLATVFEKTDEVARVMDECGYDALWLAEHHFQHEGYECLPNILMLAVHLAHVTRRLRIGCGFNIAPMWHPLRLAEDFATADILTRGRTIFGVGRGYHSREVETFGAPILDGEANRELFEEQVEIILKAFDQESFSHHGKHYTLPPAVVPRLRAARDHPGAAPHPPAGGVLAADRERPAARARLHGAPPHQGRDRGRRRHHGRGAGARLPRGGGAGGTRPGPRPRHLPGDLLPPGRDAREGDPRDHAVLRGARQDVRSPRLRAGHHPGPGGSLVAAGRLGRGGRAHRRALHEDGAWFAGPPEDLVAYLKDLESRFPGLEHVNMSISMGTPKAVMLEQLRWLAKEVMPKFSR